MNGRIIVSASVIAIKLWVRNVKITIVFQNFLLWIFKKQMWSLESGQRLLTLRCHTDGVTCLQFNDYSIVSGSYDKTVKLWDFTPSHEFLTLGWAESFNNRGFSRSRIFCCRHFATDTQLLLKLCHGTYHFELCYNSSLL